MRHMKLLFYKAKVFRLLRMIFITLTKRYYLQIEVGWADCFKLKIVCLEYTILADKQINKILFSQF